MTTAFRPAGITPEDDAAELRQLAVTRLRKKRDLQAHLLAYVLVNLFLIIIWLVTMPGGFFWPIFPLLGWGIGAAFHVWDVYAPEDPPEDRIRREMDRLSRG
ncbi:2TM domain-containing protein [Pseudosporangium ferrugineum]|uniref:2TM domain-containing protein n=1 Tax=Pseudosporangium ferrugineum TaxID=439699 RepID=A0A2T0SBF7_9ACTN|nr:2TM domain-containing protein [Pseudosporangium ferrugineum]PRY30742.1 2TM domain-containing protein [Pseudosporangium ferrugineum]